MKTIELLPLAYALDALEPAISRKTMDLHYNHHLKGYIDKTNILLEKAINHDSLALNSTLEDLIKSLGPAAQLGYENWNLYNQAAQVWNHYFYFNGLRSSSKNNQPRGILLQQIVEKYKSFEGFKKEFSQYAKDLFGSGYTWLRKDLKIVNTVNAINPLTFGQVPILCIDNWEHSYYLDVFNKRSNYIDAIWSVINWNKIEERFNR